MRGKTEAKENLALLIKKGKVLDIDTAKKIRGNWRKLFKNDQPIVLELGMGSGLFMKNLVLRDQKNCIKKNYIGLEIKGDRLWKSFRKLEELKKNCNIELVNMNVEKINQVFTKNEIDEIYIVYPDPWPKARHEKKRMTGLKFMEIYEKILKPGGQLFFKSDNKQLFEFTKEQFKSKKWKKFEESNDLMKSKYDLKEVETDYEKVFKLRNKNFII